MTVRLITLGVKMYDGVRCLPSVFLWQRSNGSWGTIGTSIMADVIALLGSRETGNGGRFALSSRFCDTWVGAL